MIGADRPHGMMVGRRHRAYAFVSRDWLGRRPDPMTHVSGRQARSSTGQNLLGILEGADLSVFQSAARTDLVRQSSSYLRGEDKRNVGGFSRTTGSTSRL